MYQPPHHRETRPEVMHGLMRAHPLGLLVSNGPDGPVADLLPFLLDADEGPHGRLRAHLSRANAHWSLIEENPEARLLVVFQGADTYITPSWYETKRETGKVVPTWNYAIVQARGTARVIHDRDWLAGQIAELTATHEAGHDVPWRVTDAPQKFVEAQLKGIIGLEIAIEDLQGKWKVSQNRPAADRAGVVAGLDARGGVADSPMAEMVRAYGRMDKA